LKRAFAHMMLFCGVFFAASMVVNAAVRLIAPPPYMGMLTDKIAAFETLRDKVDIVFIGTSRTFRQVNTPLIETRLKEKGCGAYTVFNMGIPNLTYGELRYVLDHMYAAPTPRLKLVILDEPMPAVRPELGRLRSDRVRFFSDWRGTGLRFEDIASAQENWPKKAAHFGIAVLGFLYEQTSVGHLSRLAFPELYAKKSEADPEAQNMPRDWWPTRGYFSLEEQGHVNEAVQTRHTKFMQGLEKFSAQLTAQEKSPPAAAAFSSERARLFGAVFDQITAHGQIAGLYLPPLSERVAENAGFKAAVQKDFPETKLFYYNDPVRFGMFWNGLLWFDEAHLNDAGSRMLSEEMVPALCGITKTWKGAQHAVR